MTALVRPGHDVTAISARSPSSPAHPAIVHAIHINPPLLRTADGHDLDERRTSGLELFFDLVFAGAIAQLAGALQNDLLAGDTTASSSPSCCFVACNWCCTPGLART